MSNTTAPTPELVLAVTTAEATAVMLNGASAHHPPRDRFQPAGEDSLHYLEGLSKFLIRSEAEVDTNHKQLIVYVIIRHCGRILCYRRGKGGGEKRLHAQRSIGVGGHINPEDYHSESPSPIRAAVAREISEEIGVDLGMLNPVFLGLVSEEDSAVGRVHLGLVFELELAEIKNISFEDVLTDPEWLSEQELRELTDLETWSKMVMDGLQTYGLQTHACVEIDLLWFTRLLSERDQNAERSTKLSRYINDNVDFLQLPQSVRRLLHAQLGVMQSLGHILDLRIDSANNK